MVVRKLKAVQQAPQDAPGNHELAERRTHHAAAISQMVIAVAVTLAVCYLARVVLITIIVAVFLAFVLEPVVRGLARLRFPRPLGAFIAMLLLFAVLGGLGYFFYNRAVSFVQELPKYRGRIESVLSKVREQAQKMTQGSGEPQQQQPQSSNGGQGTNWLGMLGERLGSVTELALIMGFIPFLAYFMLTWQEHARSKTVMLFRMENRTTASVTLGRVSKMMHSFILGNFFIGVFMSVVSAIVFGFLHLPYFYFLGFLSGFLSLVPYLGVILAIVPPLAAGMGVLNGGGFLAVAATVFGTHILSFNVLYPKLLGQRLQLNPLVVTLALLFWGWLWGAMGLILAVPIAGALKIVFDHVEPLRPIGAWMGE